MEQEGFQIVSCKVSDNLKPETRNLAKRDSDRHFIPAFVVSQARKE